jgi:Spy/CpxP family protein refolding chaperone
MAIGVGDASGTSSTSHSVAGPNMRRYASLGISEQQRTQIRAIVKSGKSQNLAPDDVDAQIATVLTPDQRAALTART